MIFETERLILRPWREGLQKKQRYKDLKTIPGIGKDMEQHFFDVDIHIMKSTNLKNLNGGIGKTKKGRNKINHFCLLNCYINTFHPLKDPLQEPEQEVLAYQQQDSLW